MDHWSRATCFSQTGLPWVPPSPGMPTPATALVYGGMGLFEVRSFAGGHNPVPTYRLNRTVLCYIARECLLCYCLLLKQATTPWECRRPAILGYDQWAFCCLANSVVFVIEARFSLYFCFSRGMTGSRPELRPQTYKQGPKLRPRSGKTSDSSLTRIMDSWNIAHAPRFC